MVARLTRTLLHSVYSMFMFTCAFLAFSLPLILLLANVLFDQHEGRKVAFDDSGFSDWITSSIFSLHKKEQQEVIEGKKEAGKKESVLVFLLQE